MRKESSNNPAKRKDDNPIEISKNLLKQRFALYNEKYFNGVLGNCEFHFLNKRNSTLGRYNEKINSKGKTPQIWMGRNVIWTDKLLENVLVHEMIHMYNFTIEKCKFDGILGHGRLFRRQCKRLRKDFGLKISAHSVDCKVEYIYKKAPTKLWERILLAIIDR